MNNLINKILLCFFTLVTSVSFAQEENDTLKKAEDKPVKNTFESIFLINHQTCVMPYAKTLEADIQHRFGTVNEGITDLFGMYAPSNIRIGINYAFHKNFNFGIGTIKYRKIQDLNYKIALFRQMTSNKIPVSITFFGNTSIDASKDDRYKTKVNRMSYLNELIISRKFSDAFSIQISGRHAHFNLVDTLLEHDNYTVSVGGRIKFTSQSSFLFEYDFPLTDPKINKFLKGLKQPTIGQQNIALGYEVSTGSHAFQIFFSTYDAISPQHDIAYNVKDFSKKEILIGFNITRLWNF